MNFKSTRLSEILEKLGQEKNQQTFLFKSLQNKLKIKKFLNL
jgi:hypothetical protein